MNNIFESNKNLSFDDVLIDVQFSTIRSRSEVTLTSNVIGLELDLPVISSNMDSVTESKMAVAMAEAGAVGCLHRFMGLDENVSVFSMAVNKMIRSETKLIKPLVSVGLDKIEYERAIALVDAGATHVVIDVAHGANIAVVEQYDRLRSRFKDTVKIIVGNFANAKSIEDFIFHSKSNQKMDAAKLGVGGGSACTTRLVTGSGRSTLNSIIDCRRLGIPSIADGGLRTSGDIAKALAAGASAVMLGGMLAGTDEAPGEIVWKSKDTFLTESEAYPIKHDELDKTVKINLPAYKKYRGSASKESYEIQNKNSNYISPEGESFMVEYKGPVANILNQIEGGLRSALTYSGAKNLSEFRERAKFVEVSSATAAESKAHGMRN